METKALEISQEIVYVKRLLIYMGFEKFVKDPVNVYYDKAQLNYLKMRYIVSEASILISFFILLENLLKRNNNYSIS